MSVAIGATSPHYYNEYEPYAAAWLRNLIAAGHIPAGDVDERSIVDVAADDLAGYRQCHFFAGIGGWALAARLAGWPEDRELWTGSCPCQPFSAAGKQLGAADERHLWPHQFRVIRARRPAVWMGEQVAAAVGMGWVDGVLADLESIDYAGRAIVLPACAVDAPHRRNRIGIVADTSSARLAKRVGFARVLSSMGREPEGQDAADDVGTGMLGDASGVGRPGISRGGETRTAKSSRSAWSGAGWIIGHDGKARRVKPGVRLLASGIPARVGKLRAYGNGIVPPLWAQVIAAYQDCRP